MEGPVRAASITEARARTNRAKRKNNLVTTKLQSLGKAVSHLTVAHAAQRGVHYSLCFQTQGLSVSILSQAIVHHLRMATNVESPKLCQPPAPTLQMT